LKFALVRRFPRSITGHRAVKLDCVEVLVLTAALACIGFVALVVIGVISLPL
jgi:hypothetical protein